MYLYMVVMIWQAMFVNGQPQSLIIILVIYVKKKYFNKDLYIIRDGSYKLPKSFCLTYRCDALPKINKLPDLGFRCVKDIE